jgi:hypothetical protein
MIKRIASKSLSPPRLESGRKNTEMLKAWEPSKGFFQAIPLADLVGMAQRLQNAFGSQARYFNRKWTFREVIVSKRWCLDTLREF